jgi:Tfp pilus assembly protein PilF
LIRGGYQAGIRPEAGGAIAISPTRRALMSAALFGVTLFLFRSFESHREDLAKDLADRGRAQLQAGQPAPAVVSFRGALSYAPDDYQTQLLLAQALAESGETDQAMNYFLNLWEARPGDGFLNLQLARLNRLKADRKDAVLYYRASIFGDWRGDGTIKRRDVRLELADYLIAQHDDPAARVELLIAAGNSPPNLHLNRMFGDKLLAAGDPDDALAYYQKAISDDPHNAGALEGAGRILYGQGDYERATPMLARALEYEPGGASGNESLAKLARDADRMVHLSLSRELPAHERAQHILAAAKIAQARLTACATQTDSEQAAAAQASVSKASASVQASASLDDLQAQWKAASEGAKRNALAENAVGEDTLTQLIFDTERRTAQVCGAPTGDDALLLNLAEHTQTAEAP